VKKKSLNPIELHTAGATVSHRSPFEDLPSLESETELTKEFIDRWVIPYYMKLSGTEKEWIDHLAVIKHEITDEIIQQNLGDFNWRTRQTGAFFAAITNKPQYIDVIGTHLLKSEVCYAGAIYCKVLAFFNTEKCVDYLNRYLGYYLTQPDLWYDQQYAMEAILYLDKINGTNHFDLHRKNWKTFIENKPYWKEEIKTDQLDEQLAVIKAIQEE